MKLSVKVALILACVLIVAGAALFFGAASTMNFDIRKASMTAMVTNSYDITEDFSSICVSGRECIVKLLPSEDNTCKVVVQETEKLYHTVSVHNGVLNINRIDVRNLIDYIGIHFYPLEVNIYLPQKELNNIDINIINGNIDIKSITCQKVTASVISGHIFIWDSYADTVDLKTTSGMIGFYNGDGKNITLKTVTGGINASLLTGKTFDVHTTTGRITVPADSSPDPFIASTVNGDIYISVE